MDTATAEAFQVMGEHFADLSATILHGWPLDDLPTEQEAEQIEATFHELCLHDLGSTDAQRWYVAGNIVGRFRRAECR